MSRKHNRFSSTPTNEESPMSELLSESTVESSAKEDPMYPMFRDIVSIQLSVNNAMAGPDWITAAIDGTVIDYSWAALDESAELWRCAIPFKFWDKTEFQMDSENARMEVVDLLHFAVAQQLAVVNHVSNPEDEDELVSLVASEITSAAAVENIGDAIEQDKQAELRASLKAFIHDLTTPSGALINWGALFRMSRAVGMTPDTLGALYKAKAILNKFRTQMRANGKYSKVWLDSKEDNYYLTQWLASQPSLPAEAEVMNWLVTTYRRMIPQ
jgi:hypothetical protein